MAELSLTNSFELALFISHIAGSYTAGEFLTAVSGVIQEMVAQTPPELKQGMVKFTASLLRETAKIIEADNPPCGDYSHATKTNSQAS